MTIDDLFLEQQLQKMNKLDSAWTRFQAEADELDRASHRGVIASCRGGVASILARAGARLDRAAVERALTPSAR